MIYLANNAPVSDAERNEIFNLYESGLTMDQVATQTGRAKRTVAKLIKRAGLSRHPVANLRHTVNVNYFKQIDTEEKAYWFGFLLADGHITKQTSPVLRINLGARDITHLEAFRTCIDADYLIKPNKNRNKNPNSRSIRMHICRQQFVENLLAHGWTDFKNGGWYTNILPSLERHLLRGYLDGDGWITPVRTSNPPVGIGYCSQFKHHLHRFCDMLGISPKIHKAGNIWKFTKCGKECLRLYKYLYDDATVWLARKRQRLEELSVFKPSTVVWTNRMPVTIGECTRTVADWCEHLDQWYGTVHRRIRQNNWEPERALTVQTPRKFNGSSRLAA